MRLKFLFFPVMLVISVAVFLGYIWPEIETAKLSNQDYLAHQQQLQQANDKQSAIDSLSNKMKQDPSVTQAVIQYLPQTRSQEQVINSINFVATSASVALGNISLTDVSPAATDQGVAAVPAQGTANIPNSLLYTEATISASGSYDNLGIFLSGLQHSGMYNEIKSLTITGNNATDPQLLTANVTADFGYMPPVRFSSQMLATFQPSLDDSSVQLLQKYVSNKAQDIDLGSTGKENPFQF
jgi:Tfp pilus assembly protein PilO